MIQVNFDRPSDRLSQWLDRASSEGRAALESLRGSSTDTENLPVALRDVAEVCRPDSMQIVFLGEWRRPPYAPNDTR